MTVSELLHTLEADGRSVGHLGADVPLEAVTASVEEHRTDVLAVSMTMASHVAQSRRSIQAARSRCGEQRRIVIGGAAFALGPGLARELGADALAGDVRSAVETMRALG